MSYIVQAINSVLQLQIPKSVSSVTLPIAFHAIFLRKRDGYHYRRFISIVCYGLITIFGSVIIIVLKLLKRDQNTFGVVLKLHSKIAKSLLAFDALVEGKENLMKPGQSAVYVCNHQTMMDTHFMGFAAPQQASLIAKKSIKYYPFFGQFMTMFGTIFVDRSNHNDAVAQARQAAEQMIEKKTSIWAFPEGTRSGGQEIDLLPFKKGVFYTAVQAKVPIVPVVIANYKHIYDTKKKHCTHGTVNIKVLPPIPTKDIPEDSESIAKLIADVRGQMLTTLKEISVPVDMKDKTKRAKI